MASSIALNVAENMLHAATCLPTLRKVSVFYLLFEVLFSFFVASNLRKGNVTRNFACNLSANGKHWLQGKLSRVFHGTLRFSDKGLHCALIFFLGKTESKFKNSNKSRLSMKKTLFSGFKTSKTDDLQVF